MFVYGLDRSQYCLLGFFHGENHAGYMFKSSVYSSFGAVAVDPYSDNLARDWKEHLVC